MPPPHALLLLLMFCLLAACARPPDEVLRIGLTAPAVTLDPRYATDATSYRLCRLIFDAPEFGVAPGQAAVLYDGDHVLGGGWIAETVSAATETLSSTHSPA